MRPFAVLAAVCICICPQLYSQDQKKATASDQKAFVAARATQEPQQKIDALRSFVRQYLKSSRVGSANGLILETLVKNFPTRTEEIEKQVRINLKHAKN